MPSFLIDKENYILLSVPKDKSYITAHQDFQMRSGQKGETCWYYVLNYLRPRYGKTIDSIAAKAAELEDSDSDALAALSFERAYEKQLSQYRKQTTHARLVMHFSEFYLLILKENNVIPNKAWAENRLLNIFDDDDLSLFEVEMQEILEKKIKEEIHLNIDTLFLYKALEKLDKKELECNLLNDFLKQDHHETLTMKFIETTYQRTLLENSKLMLKDDAVGSSEDEDIKVTELRNRTKIIGAAIQHYQLPISRWNPKLGINNLIQNLKKFGPHAAGGQIGIAHHKRKSNLKGEMHTYKIHELSDDSFTPLHTPHTVLIIGAEKDNLGNELVYFIDPLLPTDTISVSSYKTFCKGLIDIFGKPYDENAEPSVYAVCPNENEINDAIKKFEKLNDKYKLALFNKAVGAAQISDGVASSAAPKP